MSMISSVLSLIILLAASWGISRTFNRRIEECVPVVFTGTIVFLYIFYCFDLLRAGRFALYAVCAAALTSGIVQTLRKKKKVDFFTPGIALFLSLSVFFLIFSISLKPAVWDELRLWAAMPKALHFSEAFQVGEGSLLYSTMQSYPPGMALLICFFTALTPAYSYGSAFAVYWIFTASLILPAFRHLRWKQWYLLPFSFAAFLILPVILTVNGGGPSGDWFYYYETLYIEPILGCLFGAALFQAVKQPFRSAFSSVQFALSLFVLPAFKNIGAIYAAVVFLAALVLWILRLRKNRAKTPFGILFSAASIAASYFSWQFLIHTKGTGEFIELKISEFTGEKLGNVLSGLCTWGSIPFLFYMIFFLAAGLLLTFLLKDIEKKEALVCALGILVSFLIFLYGYTSHYGLMLSSIHRYTSVFTFACFVYLLMRGISGADPRTELSFSKNRKERSRGHALNPENRESDPNPDEVRTGTDPAKKSILATLLPKKGIRAERVLILGVLFMAAAILIVCSTKKLQLKNETYPDAKELTVLTEAFLDGREYSASQPAKCYLALGGDTRKESQRHETYALELIGSSANVQSIWCDKLVNEAEEGIVEDPEEAARIWAQNLRKSGFEYVICARADDEILAAIHRIAPEADQLSAGETGIYRVVPAENTYGITLETP